MSRPTRLQDSEIIDRLKKLPNWEFLDGCLHRSFQFSDFSAAWGFMTRSALAAEKLDHHPDWSNVYNRVTVKLSTHDQGGVTELDFQLAALMSAYVKS